MIELNFDENSDNFYNIISRSDTTITIEVDSSAFSAYISGGTVQLVAALNQTAEIELHAFILDLNPSALLV